MVNPYWAREPSSLTGADLEPRTMSLFAKKPDDTLTAWMKSSFRSGSVVTSEMISKIICIGLMLLIKPWYVRCISDLSLGSLSSSREICSSRSCMSSIFGNGLILEYVSDNKTPDPLLEQVRGSKNQYQRDEEVASGYNKKAQVCCTHVAPNPK